MTRRHVFLATMGVLMMALTVQAQPGGPGREQGGRRGPGVGLAGGAVGILQMQDVQDDLQLSIDQKDKIAELAHEMETAFGGRRQQMRDLPSDERRAKMEEMRKEVQERGEKAQKQIEQILDAEQLKRLKEIRLQAAGLAALDDSDVVKALELKPEQREKIDAIRKDVMEKADAMRQDLGSLSREERREKMSEVGEKMRTARKEALAKALEVLTEQQRETFDKLLGKKLNVDFPQPMMGFGGRGGRGGRPGDDTP